MNPLARVSEDRQCTVGVRAGLKAEGLDLSFNRS